MTFQVNCVGQFSQFLWCFILTIWRWCHDDLEYGAKWCSAHLVGEILPPSGQNWVTKYCKLGSHNLWKRNFELRFSWESKICFSKGFTNWKGKWQTTLKIPIQHQNQRQHQQYMEWNLKQLNSQHKPYKEKWVALVNQ